MAYMMSRPITLNKKARNPCDYSIAIMGNSPDLILQLNPQRAHKIEPVLTGFSF
ncbi:MAG: hypothetical protein RIE73_02545 [Coleofasciculus sp. C1-SOL-03]|jgi:hypothetical protein